MLDASAFPTASAYVRSLPAGLDSFPDCTARPETYEGVRIVYPADRIPPDLPEPVACFFRGQWTGWRPEVVPLVGYLMLVDVMGREAFLDWAHHDAARLFQRAFIRHLMKLVSPTLVAMGAASRWRTLRRGTTMETSTVARVDDRMVTQTHVGYPTGLYPEIFAHALTRALEAAISGARGRDIRVELLEYAPDHMVHAASWTA